MKNKIITLFLGLAVIITAGSGTPRLTPWDAWRMAYTTFEQGEEFRDKGEYTKARESFDKALSYYRMVRSARPDWNQRVISERIADCERESQKMTAFLGQESSSQSTPSASSAVQQARASETEDLRRELAEAKAELEELRKKNTSRVNYETEIANLLRDQRVLNERYYLLERRYRDAETKLAAPDVKSRKLEEQLVTLRLQLDLARRETAAAKQQSTAAQAERNQLRSGKTEAENARRLAESQKDLISGQLELAKKNNKKLQSDLNSSSLRIRELIGNLEQSRKNNSAISRELTELQGKYREKLRASSAGEEVNSRLLDENKKLQNELTASRKRTDDISATLLKSQRENELLRTNLSNERRQLTADRSELDTQKRNVKSLTAELEREKANSVILSRELTSLRNNESSNAKELKTLKNENSELKKRLKFRESEEFRNLTAANEERKKLRNDAAKLEQSIAGLQADLKIRNNQYNALERSVQELQSENRKLHTERINYESRIKTLAGANANIQELARKYDELKRNFSALQAENRQNKLAADAAKPREAELARIKLRLAELDGLKKQLSQEQSFNEQLNAVKRNLEQEVKQLRPMGEENARLKSQLADFKLLKSESERLRKLNAELAGAKQLESEVADLKVKLAQLSPEAAEAAKLRKRNLELEQGKILWENEISKLKLQLTEIQRLKDEIKKLNVRLQGKDLELRSYSLQISKLTDANTTLGQRAEELQTLKDKSSRLVKDQALLLGQIKDQEGDLKQLKNNLVQRDKVITALRLELKNSADNHRNSALKLQDEIFNLKKLISEQKEQKNALVADLDKKYGSLQQEYAVLQKKLEQERTIFARKKAEQDNGLIQKIVAENKQLRENTSLLARIRETVKDLQKKNIDLLRENSGLKQELSSRKTSAEKHNAALTGEIALLKKNTSGLQDSLESVRKENTLLKEVNAKNVNLESELADIRRQNLKLQSEVTLFRQLQRELTRVKGELSKKDHDLGIARKQNEQLLGSASETLRLKEDIKAIRKLNTDLAEQRLKSESELTSLKSELANYNRLRNEVRQLRRLNRELADAKNLESELAQAKLRISRLEQMRDELSRQRRLNEELSAAKMKLEHELANRPAMPSFAPADYVAPAGNPSRPIGKAEDYITAGKIAAADEKEDLAIWNYRTALKLDPENSEAAELLGRALASKGDYTEAAPMLSRARNGRPDSIDLALATANAYIALGRYGNAEAVIEPLLKRNKENPQLQITAALVAAGSGKYARAAGLLRLAAAKLPNDPTPKLELARLLLNTDSTRIFEAVKLYETARRLGAGPDLELEPKLAPFLNNRRNMSDFLNSAAAEAAGNKDWTSVIWYNRQLIELDREPEKYRPRLAFAQYKKGSSGAALETLSMGIRTPLSMLLKAFIHQQRKESREASQCALQAKALNHGRMIEIPADWREFLIEFRRHGGKLRALAK